jgi:hypothetical protein
MESHRDESDQLPEDAPPEQISDDDEVTGSRDDAEGNAGVPDEDGQATGEPKNAG